MEKTKKRTLILSGILLLGAALLRWPDFFGICAQVGIDWNGGSGCYLDAYNYIGIPAFAFIEIILVAGILWFVALPATRRRWNRFGIIFIVISAALLTLAHPYERGLLGLESVRSEFAAYLSLIFGTLSALLILISEILSRRKHGRI